MNSKMDNKAITMKWDGRPAESPIAQLARSLCDFDFLCVNRVFEKRIVFSALTEAFSRARVDINQFIRFLNDEPSDITFSLSSRETPLWLLLWRCAAKDRGRTAKPDVKLLTVLKKYSHDIEEKNIVEYNQRLISEMERDNHVTFNFSHIARHIAQKTRNGDFRHERWRRSLLVHLWNAATFLAYFTYHGAQLENCAAVEPLYVLLKEGYGMPYVIFGRRGKRLEFRIPVWNAGEYPEVHEDEDVLWFGVSVIMDSVFISEDCWRNPEKLMVQDILYEDNVEVRRVMARCMGSERLVKESHAELVDESVDYKLYRVTFQNEERQSLPEDAPPAMKIGRYRVAFPDNSGPITLYIVRCVCPSTGREYYLYVPPFIRKAREAVAWTFGETEATYFPRIET